MHWQTPFIPNTLSVTMAGEKIVKAFFIGKALPTNITVVRVIWGAGVVNSVDEEHPFVRLRILWAFFGARGLCAAPT